MHLTNLIVIPLITTSSATILDVLSARQASNNTDEAYLQEVCFPPATDPIPPCQSIINIQTACEPNGTEALALEAHAQCMCGGSFFADWIGCLDCNYVHGGRSPQVVSAFNTIITSASNILCTGTPTASFAAIFSGLSEDSGVAENGDTSVSDKFPSQTAVSLYYKPSGKQGPGAITGSATAATATGPTSETAGTTSESESESTGGSATSRATAATTGSSTSASGDSTSTSTAGAAPTGVWTGALGVVAGGIVMIAL